MATVYQSKRRPGWFCDYTDAAGRRHVGKRLPATVTTRRQAEAAARAIEHAVGVERAPLPGLAVARTALDDWLVDREARRSPATATYYRKHARAWESLPLAGPLSGLTPSRLSAYLLMRSRAASKQTADKERTSLSAWLSWCRKRGLIEANPIEAVDRFGAPPNERAPADSAQVAAILKALWSARRVAAEERTRHALGELCAAYRLLWWTGQRIGQLCSVRRSDVDLELAAFRIVDTKRRVATPRLLPIPRPIIRLVTRLLARGFSTMLATHEGLPAENSLRLTLARWRVDHPDAIGFIFHAFRHAYASRSEAAGLDPVLRSRGLLGHQTIQMTARYSHRALEQLRAAQDLIASSERASRRRAPPED